jgi:tRNA A22 N-methylase
MKNSAVTLPASDYDSAAVERYMDRRNYELSREEYIEYANAFYEVIEAHREKDDERY